MIFVYWVLPTVWFSCKHFYNVCIVRYAWMLLFPFAILSWKIGEICYSSNSSYVFGIFSRVGLEGGGGKVLLRALQDRWGGGGGVQEHTLDWQHTGHALLKN